MKAKWRGQDPEAAQEAQKYENPIPSRTLILQHLAERGAPASREQLCAEFGLCEEDDIEAIRRRLRAMERDAQVVYTRRGAYAPVDKLDLVAGRVQGHRDGFGWLLPEGEGEDIFLSPVQMRTVFHGDRVLVRVAGFDKRGRKEGVVAEVVERARESLVGRYQEENGLGFVIPDNTRMQHEIIITPGMSAGAHVGQLVEVCISHWPTARMPAQGQVVRVLGDYMAPGMEIDVAIRNYDIPHEWPEAVLKEAARFKGEVSERDKLKRVDLRELPFVTIDGADARDFDDAVYCEPASRPGQGGWQLYVAIADVSHYVQVGSALDAEASVRGNSVYFPERVIPMLPVELSNGLCSLNPDVDRLAMVCQLQVSRNGKIQDYCFFEAVIRSHARLTYDEVSVILEQPDSKEGKAANKQRKTLVPHLQQLYSLYQALARQRKQRGAIDFETRETYIVFGEDRKIAEILPTVRNDAHKLIEECMLCANVAMADFLHIHKLPGLYRIHDGPPEAKLEKLQGFLATLGLSLNKGKQAPTPRDYLRLLEQVHDRPDFELIQTVMLRSLSQAEYSPDDIGHFGLNYETYTHFTSPIRRYADLLNHRAVRSVIRSKRQSEHVVRAGAGPLAKAKIYPYDLPRLETIGAAISATERRADEATRDVVTWLKCEFMLERIGETYSGVVTSVTGFGLFVELNDIYVEGMVHITALPADYYHFEAVYHRLVGERSGRSYRLGDSIEVVVARVDLDERKIDFELSAAEHSAPVTRRTALAAPAVEKGGKKPAKKDERRTGKKVAEKKAGPAAEKSKGKKRKAVSKSRKSGYYE
ncbi:ribonuclease R [Thiopseudomonas denitrificans]|uniref:Ribonuclease R n=1 Tax=Thiopseudomonas denitrificans TaxID=1501432 RepID=A0A4R6TZX8_9GAMM|nr:ribonuclease R [Thiopseudomonas denitrificans]TDQ38936.1 RNAse R [Thiopseudomonas denitrificans]